MTSETQAGFADRNFFPLLLVLAMAGLIPRMIVGNVQPIGMDGWWHLFAATQDNWPMLVSEWIGIAHPPLFYPLLRLAARIGHSPLVLRSIGIFCGCASTVVLGVIAAKIYRFKVPALLAAAAYTFSWSMIGFHSDLRAYPIALLFVMLAFNAWVDWFANPSGTGSGRAIARFGAYSLLAMLCEYYVVFFVAGCLGILVLRAVRRPPFRALLMNSLRVDWKLWTFAIASPAILFVGLLTIQVNDNLVDLPYIKNYIWNPEVHPSIDWFLLVNAGREIGYFTPFDISPDFMLPLVCLLFIPALLYFVIARRELWRGAAAAATALLAAALLGQMLVLSVAKKYPFGGEFRHQSIAAPFVFLTAFLLVDLVAGALRASRLRYALFTTTGLLVCASFAFGWSLAPWNMKEPNWEGNARFRQFFPNPENIYIDRISTILFFGENYKSNWSYQDQFFIDGHPIVAYRVDDGKSRPVRVLLKKNQRWFELLKPETYRILAETLQHEKLKSAVLFFMSLKWDDRGAVALEEAFRTMAPAAGLECGRYEMGRNYLFIEFKLRDSPPWDNGEHAQPLGARKEPVPAAAR